MANNASGNRGKEETRTAGPGMTGGTTGGQTGGATGVMDKARDVASNVADRAKDTASTVADTARDWASTAGQKAEGALESVGSGMTSLAGSVRESVPSGGVLGSAGHYVADALESGGRYLQQEGFRGIGEDLTNMIRRNPIPALLLGIGVGYLLARATSSRS